VCAPATALPRTAHQGSVETGRTATILIVGASTGVFGLVAFGTAHAPLILPIWTRLVGGLPFALAADVAFAAAASLTMMLASGGPLPLTQSARGLWLALAFLPICIAGGIVTAAVHARFSRELS
jgi:hypothetical protein